MLHPDLYNIRQNRNKYKIQISNQNIHLACCGLFFLSQKKCRFEYISRNSTYCIIIIGYAKITNSRVEIHQPVAVSSYSLQMFKNLLYKHIRPYAKEFSTIKTLQYKVI